jgi:hypothetical protein
MLLLILLLATATLAQSPSCFPITGSVMCPTLDGFLVQASPLSFTNVSSFDSYIESQLPQSGSYIQEFQEYYGCTGFFGHFERFHQSTLCSFLVEKSGCVQSNPIPSLCQESCDSFIGSGVAILKNTTACPEISNATVLAEREGYSFNSPFLEFCSELSPQSVNAQCSKGQAVEAKLCGISDFF